MRKIALFFGCLIPNRYPGIEMATNLCLATLDIDFAELESASCCPAPGVFRSFDEMTWLTIAARNLALAEKMDRDILTVCNGCFGSLNEASSRLDNSNRKNKELRLQVNKHLEKIGLEYNGTVKVRHIIEFLSQEFGSDKISELVTHPLKVNVAVHYGCHMVKPTEKIKGDSAENPVFFDLLVEATGANSISYPDKNQCCGAGGGVRAGLHDRSIQMVEHKLKMIRSKEIDCIVDACPFCHMQFDSGQYEINNTQNQNYKIPVLHYTQLLALSLGYGPEDVGIDQNVIKNNELE
ncbi:CoB--CoM heterodisulfide reductase subunit B [Methanosalsum natronophilum]|uniref:CoB--CoM heterodisulfide reductase subunit B n=1 Tax=Methanosalsum natronophilum TaxID=768733 RepID=A0A3R7XI12_9EURY|nr:CoB--CoM heterodisulfide reductase subunit B [Methanosalsum natronophilum]MCS3924783.1 heterodisulfide reductase subunit B [Methanosalsum natronophilum]RQD85208.1 MAG: CoB--CoM heterodisulfide reductase subunit B [Methanosalsum natronophilum]